jgi:hypothetical protein
MELIKTASWNFIVHVKACFLNEMATERLKNLTLTDPTDWKVQINQISLDFFGKNKGRCRDEITEFFSTELLPVINRAITCVAHCSHSSSNSFYDLWIARFEILE